MEICLAVDNYFKIIVNNVMYNAYDAPSPSLIFLRLFLNKERKKEKISYGIFWFRVLQHNICITSIEYA